MTRIAVVSELSGGVSDIAATTRRTLAMVAFCEGKGWEVRLIVPRTESLPASVCGRVPTEWLKTYETRRTELKSPLAVALLPIDVIRFVKVLKRFEPAAVLITGNSPFLLISALLAAKLLALPVAFDVRDSWLLLGAFHPGRLRNAIRRRMEGFALRRGDLVIAVTPTLVPLLQEGYRIVPQVCLLVPNCTNQVAEPSGSALPVYDLVHAGPPRDYYDNEGLLDAIGLVRERMAGVRVVFLGIEAGESRMQLETELRRRGLTAGIDLLPWIPEDRVSDEIRRARIGLISLTRNRRYRAAVSTKFYAYLEAGVPILFLGPSDSEQARLIQEYRVGLVCESPQELASAVQRLLQDPEELLALRTETKAASSRLNWRDVLEPLFSRLLEMREAKGFEGR